MVMGQVEKLKSPKESLGGLDYNNIQLQLTLKETNTSDSM